jgi:hypothetical protein
VIGPGIANDGVLAFGGEIIGHSDVDGKAEGELGTGTVGTTEDVGVVVSRLFASCSSTYNEAFFMTA